MSQATIAPAGGTVAGRPQPQTTAQPTGGPFVRHAPDGRRAQYIDTQGFGGFMSRPTVSMPGYCKGYRLAVQCTTLATVSSTAGTLAADAPAAMFSLVQMKDAFGTQLIVGPGYEMLYLVPLYSGQFGTDTMRSPWSSPQLATINTSTSGSTTFGFSTYLPFEFAKAYGVISGANAALLPVFQANIGASSTVWATHPPATVPVFQEQLDSDFYWLPSAPTDPPGLGTTCQWIYQQATPQISATSATSSSQLVQLPRLGGYLTALILELRDNTGARITTDAPQQTNKISYNGQVKGEGWPARPKILVDGVPLIDTGWGTLCEDLAISTGIGAIANPSLSASAGANAGTTLVPRPTGTIAINRKTSLSQRDFGLLDTGEIFLSPLALDTPVPTTDGPVPMGEIKPGMFVYGSDGEPTPVLGVSRIFTGRDCYRVTFEHGESFTADAEHLWPAFGKLTRTDELLAGDVIGEHKISGIEPVASVATRCLATGRNDHLFRIGTAGVLTKNTNPGTQIEVAGYPWGYNNAGASPTSMTLNAIVGQVVPTGALVQGLPEV